MAMEWTGLGGQFMTQHLFRVMAYSPFMDDHWWKKDLYCQLAFSIFRRKKALFETGWLQLNF